MAGIYKPPRVTVDVFGKPIVTNKTLEQYQYLVNQNINDIILFDNGSDELFEQGRIILPRHCFIFVGTRDGQAQFKPYEYNQYRIVVSTYRDIITSVDSIG
jgi:hypothetical protein